MKRRIKTIHLKDGKQIFYPTDAELKELWDYVEEVEIEERYTIEEWKGKFVVIRSFDDAWYCDKCKIYHSKDHVCVRI